MEDPFLNYFALGLLFFVVIVLVYGIIAVSSTSSMTFPLISSRSGAAGEAAIYTEHFPELSLLRKILLRMRSWQNYVFFEGI
jgi:hypothetical protein